jgi:ubiquinone/menaquinone biosynthesis C-methylase UbiE
MPIMPDHTIACTPNLHVPESKFGIWFLGTETWAEHVLLPSVKSLERLMVDRKAAYPVIVDIGSGWGYALPLLSRRFSPQRLIGVDIDPAMLSASAEAAQRRGLAVEFLTENASSLSLSTGSVDMVFCHQTFHHIVEQHAALKEIYRVLRPGGVFLFAESTRAYIHSWIIRLLFRHQMDVQRSADEYLRMIQDTGFVVPPTSVSYPYLWWSRPDLGLLESIFGINPAKNREETLIYLVATKP